MSGRLKTVRTAVERQTLRQASRARPSAARAKLAAVVWRDEAMAALPQSYEPTRSIYCLLAVQRPLQPSARLYEPLPVFPDILPLAVSGTPSALMLAER
jgi:hypothetical protein